jgi:hypothetical protein
MDHVSKLTNQQIAALVNWEIAQSQGFDADVLSTKRENALEYYQGLAPLAPGNGRAGIVSTDVADALHSLLAQVQPIVKTTQVEFVPTSEQDEQTCQAESDIVRQQIEQNGGYETLYDACHDALLIGNGWIKVFVDEETVDTEEFYPPNLPDTALLVLSQPTQANQTVKITTSDTRTKVKRSTTNRSLAFDSIPPENMLFNNDCSLDDVRFVAERKHFTVDELINDYGFNEQDVLSLPDALGVFNPAANARNGIYRDNDEMAPQEATTPKEVYCCYIRLSSNDNNTSELRHIWQGGMTVLKNEPADYIPYITGSAIPMPHRIAGTGLYEVVGPIQDGKTQILRQYLDNLALMNSSRIGAVEGQVNMQDLTNGRINGVVRLRSPDALVPLPSGDIGPQAMGGLNYMDQVRTQRVGAAIDFNEIQAQLASSSATAAAGQLANVEKMAGWYAGNLINTLLRPAFLLVHKVLRLEYRGPVAGKINNKWVQFDTSQWPERKSVYTTMGLTSVEKAAKINALTTLIAQQQNIYAQGGNNVLTDLGKMYNAMSDWVRANDLHDPTEYLLDPNSPEGQQGQEEFQQKQYEMMQFQQQMLQQQQQFELQKQAQELEYKKWAEMMKAEQVEADLTTKLIIADKKGTVDIQTTGMDNQVDLIEGVVKGQNQR